MDADTVQSSSRFKIAAAGGVKIEWWIWVAIGLAAVVLIVVVTTCCCWCHRRCMFNTITQPQHGAITAGKSCMLLQMSWLEQQVAISEN
jgi:hypothetical protein